jgi:hypothetical protein
MTEKIKITLLGGLCSGMQVEINKREHTIEMLSADLDLGFNELASSSVKLNEKIYKKRWVTGSKYVYVCDSVSYEDLISLLIEGAECIARAQREDKK